MALQILASEQLPLLRMIEGFEPPQSFHFLCESDPLPLLAGLPERGLAIVGTRYPQRRSVELLERVMDELRGSGLTVVSGFARGIDSRAHELAIEAGLPTIAVLGCGADVDYPRENRFLRRRILDSGGMLVSQFPLGTPAYASHFLERNQLIAGFSKATWVVEAAEVSGTLNTANWAMRLNRDLYATSCFPDDPFFKGNEKLLGQLHPNRYPLALPLFGVHSLASTWPHLAETPQLDLRPSSLSRIQRWALELKAEFGSCPIQTLMNHASSQGMTLGSFYLEFEKEIEAGRLQHHPSGDVDVIRSF